MNRPRFH